MSSVTGKLIVIASHLNRFPCSIDLNCKEFRKLVVVDVGIVGEGRIVVQGVLLVDITGGSEVELFSVCEVQVLLGLITCEGCLVVGCDHGPSSGSRTGGWTWTSR